MKLIRRHIPRIFAILLALLWSGIPSNLRAEEQATSSEDYRGFHVDYSALQNDTNLETMRVAVRVQIDIVLSVGVSPDTKTFFQSVPLVVLGQQFPAGGNPALYSGIKKRVVFTRALPSFGHKPVLLHELLHAWHHQRLPDGFKNREILTYYEQAKATNGYPANSYMLSNATE